MWQNDIYFIPIAGILTMYKLREDTHLEGGLAEEFTKLLNEYLPGGFLKIVMGKSVKSNICQDYLKGASLGMILIDIARQFSLSAKIDAMPDAIITVTLEEGLNGCPDLES